MVSATGYSVAGYGDMISDRTRTQAYAEALRRTVRPGSVVLDLGAGTGFFSLLACQYGAGHVHAVEPHDAISVGKAMAVANGCVDRITFHQKLSTAVALPKPADVMICDLRGALPLYEQHIPAILDARHRLMAAGGVLISRCDTIWAALVEDAEMYRPYTEPWQTNPYGLDLNAGHRLVTNTWRKTRAKVGHLLTAAERWACLDYQSIEHPDVDGELAWTIERPGIAHGLLVWFDAELAGGSGFSNAPGKPELVYGQAFFPMLEPIPLATGESVNIRLAATLTGDDYVWQWTTTVPGAVGTGKPRCHFRQSTFLGRPFALESLHRREAGYVPCRNEAAEVDLFLLSVLDGTKSLGEAAHLATERFPARFPRWTEALSAAAGLAERYRP